MVLYRYIKATPKKPPPIAARRVISTLFMFIGLFLLVWVSYPIVSFEIASRIKYTNIVEPVPAYYEQVELTAFSGNTASARTESTFTSIQNLAKSISEVIPIQKNETAVLGSSDSVLIEESDYTQASNWFPNKPQGYTNTAGRIYFLTIPKLRIKDAVVKISGEDLNESLIQYGGTGLPGEYGTAVVFGHSILPQFYDPTNYKSIFSLLPTINEGDELFIKFDGITYRYVVINMRVTSPDDVTVLEQRYDSSYIRLITCVPPGTYWKRLAVTARLQPQ